MKRVILFLLFLVAFLERTVFDLGPNVELITASVILASYYLGAKKSFWLTLIIMLLTDILIGNTIIFIFTWTGFLIPAILSGALFNKIKPQRISKYIVGTTTGLSANIFFYLWTNFGVWLLDAWNMYPDTIGGLISAYINALPFLRYQIIGSIIFIPLGFAAIDILMVISKRYFPISSLAKQRLI